MSSLGLLRLDNNWQLSFLDLCFVDLLLRASSCRTNLNILKIKSCFIYLNWLYRDDVGNHSLIISVKWLWSLLVSIMINGSVVFMLLLVLKHYRVQRLGIKLCEKLSFVSFSVHDITLLYLLLTGTVKNIVSSGKLNTDKFTISEL